MITTTAKASLLCFLFDMVLTEKTRALILELYLKLRLLTLFIQWFLFVKSLFLLELRLKIKFIRCPFLCIIKFFFFFFREKVISWSGHKTVQLQTYPFQEHCVFIHSFTTKQSDLGKQTNNNNKKFKSAIWENVHNSIESSGKIFFLVLLKLRGS